MSTATPQRDHAILVVDDNQEVLDLLEEILNIEGYATHLASDGDEALRLLGKVDRLPSLIVLDLRMPKMDGYAFRARQLADPALARIPVVLCSSEPDLSNHSRAMGAVAALEKPFTIPELVSLVDEQCGEPH